MTHPNAQNDSTSIYFPLLSDQDISVQSDRGFVTIMIPREDRCGSCGRHLLTLFDFDLRNPAFSFFGMQGQQLRIAMCPTCTSLDDAVFTDVNGNGLSQWSSKDNGEEPVDPLDDLNDWEDLPELSSQQLQLDSLHRIPPYDSPISCMQTSISYIGNVPTWIQNPEYPYCPGCQQRMLFIGQIALGDLHDNARGIIIYTFLCSECGKAANVCQCD